MTKTARTPTYSREATRETSFHGLTPPHFSGAFELFGHASRRGMKGPCFLRGIRAHGGWGFRPTTMCTVLFFGQGPSSSICKGRTLGPGQDQGVEVEGTVFGAPETVNRDVTFQASPTNMRTS